ncbi:hypothetical protein [Massilia sp. METH4]|uniref:hypothetical protein n=1 Tax=Massilia sp. METH4 TaxID=3123041 RepID=UPI0030CE9683
MNEKREPSLREPGVAVAARCGDGHVPPGAQVVYFAADGQARRPVAFNGKAAAPAKGETAWWFLPGPHTVELVPFAAAPEVGLRLAFVVDTPDPRLPRQRFDLFLFSEVAGQAASLALADLAARLEAALRAALEQGTVELPPCTSLDEWHAFRAGLDELLYTRFGITVDDCVPVELADVDFAAVLRGRAAAMAPHEEPAPAPAPLARGEPDDAVALRRLFLELPDASRTLRQLPAPDFATRQAQLQRLALAALDVNTMPALAWSAPGLARAPDERRRLASAAAAAMRALDELWALLARMKGAGGGDDELDRILCNLAFNLVARRGHATDERGEPLP